jgi:hypothetical protein
MSNMRSFVDRNFVTRHMIVADYVTVKQMLLLYTVTIATEKESINSKLFLVCGTLKRISLILTSGGIERSKWHTKNLTFKHGLYLGPEKFLLLVEWLFKMEVCQRLIVNFDNILLENSAIIGTVGGGNSYKIQYNY